MRKAQQGDRVKVNFTGKLDDGTVVDASIDCCEDEGCEDEGCDCETGPAEFTIGDEEVVPGMEKALIGMAPGEKKTVRLTCEEAYGERDEEMVMEVERSEIPEEIAPEIGQTLELTDEEGEAFLVTVTDITDTEVVLDANHPLAGIDITYEIELVDFA